MAGEITPRFRWSDVDGVAVVELLGREFTGPEPARELGEQLRSLFHAGHPRVLINFQQVEFLSSTAFGMLLAFYKEVKEAGGVLKGCAMSRAVRFGADVISLGQYIPLFDHEADALASFPPPVPPG